MRDTQSGEPVRISVEESLGPYLVVPAAQAEQVHEVFLYHRVPHRLYPTVTDALTIIYILSHAALDYAQSLLDALP